MTESLTSPVESISESITQQQAQLLGLTHNNLGCVFKT